MRDILGDEYYFYQGFFEKAAEVAEYYGFKPIITPVVEHEGVFTTGVGFDTDIVEKEMYTLKTRGDTRLALRPEGTAPLIRAYIEGGMHNFPQPVMLYYHGPFFRHENPQHGRFREFFQFGVELIGSPKAVSDALAIRVIQLILREVGFQSIALRVNSLGDKNCRPAYVRTLAAHYRKHIGSLCTDCRQRIKTNPLRLLDCKNEQCRQFKEDAPDFVSYLCSECKQHFKEVLEYLETIGISYEIDKTLVRGIDYYTRTVWEIAENAREEKKEAPKEPLPEQLPEGATEVPPKVVATPLTLAAGGRYDGLGKRLGSRHDIPATGGAIGVDRLISSPLFKPAMPRIIKKPKVCFIQIGTEAKLKSLEVIESLRSAKISVLHSLNKDKLSAQLGTAERLQIPFALIFGQKEALDGTVIVRDMESRSQETMKIERVGEHIRKKTAKS